MGIDPKAGRSRYVQDIFTRVAPRYDLMNRLMTGGMDVAWRRELIHRTALPRGGRLLDLGSGTGDIAAEVRRQHPDAAIFAGDFTLQMMRVGQGRFGDLRWAAADALNLPYPDASFDAVTSGFLLRNVVDLPRALSEQLRVLRPGGWLVALDTTRPQPNLLSPFIRFHMRRVIPFLGTLLTGQRDAYTYLPETSENFLKAEDLQARLDAAGFVQTGFVRRNFGTIAIHWGRRP